jgi:hypothetical protein
VARDAEPGLTLSLEIGGKAEEERQKAEEERQKAEEERQKAVLQDRLSPPIMKIGCSFCLLPSALCHFLPRRRKAGGRSGKAEGRPSGLPLIKKLAVPSAFCPLPSALCLSDSRLTLVFASTTAQSYQSLGNERVPIAPGLSSDRRGFCNPVPRDNPVPERGYPWRHC